MTVLASTFRPFSSFRHLLAALAAAAIAGACGGSSEPLVVPPVIPASISIDQGANWVLERGTTKKLTTTIKSTTGNVLDFPVVWQSSDDKKVAVDVNGVLTGLDTGGVVITAKTSGSVVTGIQVAVIQIVAKIDQFQYTPLAANSPGSLPDSLRVVVTGLVGQPVANRKINFKVTSGGGSISPASATTNQFGIAAAQWTTGPAASVNTATATVLTTDDTPITYITPSTISFTLRTYDALIPVAGNNQKAVILSALPIEPSVKVVDSTGKVRPGIPVTFAATSGGKVQTQVVSTGADGVASPGIWTLGDVPGEQSLVAKVDNATVLLKATGTGTPIYFTPAAIAAGQYVTCAIMPDSTVSCFGEQPKVGDSTTTNRPNPTPTFGGIKFTSITAGVNAPSPPSQAAHVCGVAIDKSIYCWGQFALTDTSTLPLNSSPIIPTRYPSDIQWLQVAPAQAHNCALAVDQSIQCWGDNSVGQLGDRLAAKQRYTPAPVFGGFKFTSITSGAGHTCGVATDGSAYCWGYNAFGQLGNGTLNVASSPTAVSSSLTFKQLSAGDSFTCGILTLGQAYCWGNLGGGGAPVTTPRSYTAAPNFASISSGGSHSCALTSDGTAYCWGDNSVGQLGDSTNTYRANPTLVATTVKFKSISGGYQHTCGQALNNAVLCWGLNRNGEAGDSVSAPVTARKQPRYIVLGVTPPSPSGFKAQLLKSKH